MDRIAWGTLDHPAPGTTAAPACNCPMYALDALGTRVSRPGPRDQRQYVIFGERCMPGFGSDPARPRT